MLHFLNDYDRLGHPKVLEELEASWDKNYVGYGFDTVSKEVNEKVRELTKSSQAQSFFISGGTLTNLLACSAFLLPYESIIATKTAHISNMEAGAVEATGHRVLNVPEINGKITVAGIETALKENEAETKTVPRLVFLANASEQGTVYTKAELKAISEVCRENDLILYMDGARIAFALASMDQDLTLADIAEYCDVFYLGGTKNGAMYGELLVITNPDLQKNFIRAMKNRGALLAKTFAVAVQFKALLNSPEGESVEDFAETLYIENAKIANQRAHDLAHTFAERDYKVLYPTQSNQVFVSLPLDLCSDLAKNVSFEIQEKSEDSAKCRFVCTFDTTASDILELGNLLDKLEDTDSEDIEKEKDRS